MFWDLRFEYRYQKLQKSPKKAIFNITILWVANTISSDLSTVPKKMHERKASTSWDDIYIVSKLGSAYFVAENCF